MNRFVSSDGVQIAYHTWGMRNGVRPVVLHHGFSSDAASNWVFPGVVDALVGAGRWVVGIDARGHGASDKPHDPVWYGENVMSRDLSILLDVLECTEVDLVGYSMGGVVAAITATRDARIRRLVLGGVGASVVELGGVDRRLIPRQEVVAVLLTDDADAIAGSPARGFRDLADAVGADRRALVAQLQATHSRPIPLRHITAETLVLAGTDDPFAARPEKLAAAIPGARTRTVPGDHLRALRDPAFSSAIIDFFALHETASAP